MNRTNVEQAFTEMASDIKTSFGNPEAFKAAKQKRREQTAAAAAKAREQTAAAAAAKARFVTALVGLLPLSHMQS